MACFRCSLEFGGFYPRGTGSFGRDATDPQILDTLNRAFNKAANSEGIKARLAGMAYEVTTGPRGALFDLAKKERPIWADVIRSSGATLD